MGAYREQLLKETYGNGSSQLYQYTKPYTEEQPTGVFTIFKIRFSICLLLFAGFAWLSLTGSSFCNITSEKVTAAVAEDRFPEEIYIELSKLGLYE